MRPRTLLTAALSGMFFVGSVWAGVGLAPVHPGDAPGTVTNVTSILDVPIAAAGEPPTTDELLVGAAKVSIEPNPNAEAGEVWVRDKNACLPLTTGNVEGTLTHVADPRVTWIENNNCIYMGGFGIGPSQPILAFDQEYGLWVRSAAFQKNDKTVVLSILDGEGYFAKYNRMCPTELACGFDDIQTQLGAELNLDPASFIFASTHAHSAMDFIGGWGGVPEWYMRQVANALRDSVRGAVAAMVPARLEAGDTIARAHNGERRDTYRSAEDPSVNWVRAVDRDGNVITTVGTFAAHATSFGGSATVAHADWPGVFDKTVEDRFGGIGLMFEAGLGNMSARGGHMMGQSLGNLLPAVGAGLAVTNPVVKVAKASWDQPVTNGPLGALGAGGFFDRTFSGPAVVTAGKSSAKPCRSASAFSANVSVTAARIGSVVISAAPGEVFANYTNTIEEYAFGGQRSTSLAIGQANDALGYMPQSFESDAAAREGLGFAGLGVFEYEDAYGIDLCFGDKALETTISLLNGLA